MATKTEMYIDGNADLACVLSGTFPDCEWPMEPNGETWREHVRGMLRDATDNSDIGGEG